MCNRSLDVLLFSALLLRSNLPCAPLLLLPLCLLRASPATPKPTPPATAPELAAAYAPCCLRPLLLQLTSPPFSCTPPSLQQRAPLAACAPLLPALPCCLRPYCCTRACSRLRPSSPAPLCSPLLATKLILQPTPPLQSYTPPLYAAPLLQPDPAPPLCAAPFLQRQILRPTLEPTEHDGRPASFRVSFDFCINRRGLVSLGSSVFLLLDFLFFLSLKKERSRRQKSERRRVFLLFFLVLGFLFFPFA
ncbi:hypothetical protein SLEP1_g3766 [Rubroshorea leprosula]|uniref:Uncharacterized protein n=1 Tax=Rubroshorea leprosula TaxID=152421 RepID=A0AAV5HSZ8_9ROSI|nr:hypothetical protein SLEP1_g3766 [Rubroshorea leprosula]